MAGSRRSHHASPVGRQSVVHILSISTEEALRELRFPYCIIDHILMQLPVKDERIDSPPLGWVDFYPKIFENGVRLPLNLYAHFFLSLSGLALAQLAPNVWGMMMVLTILSIALQWGEDDGGSAQCPFHIDGDLWFPQILQPELSSQGDIEGPPSNKHWKCKLFLLKW